MTLKAQQLTVVQRGRTLLDNVDLELRCGELVVVVGPNGAGKSTLLSALAGDQQPTRGRVTLMGRDLSDLALDELAAYRAVVAAPPVLAFDYTVSDVVMMGWLSGAAISRDYCDAALQQVLEHCELTALATRRYMTLSSGERQRVAFARAVMQLWRPESDTSPRWLLLDEPTANLDVAHGVAMVSAFKAMARRGDGVLAVLHDLDLAARFADRIALVVDGQLEAIGTPAEVLTAQRLSDTYQSPIHVEQHGALGRLVVIG